MFGPDGAAMGFIELVEDITERKRAEEALREAKDYTDNIIRSMADMLVVLSPDGAITSVNKAACNLLGYSEDELFGTARNAAVQRRRRRRRKKKKKKTTPSLSWPSMRCLSSGLCFAAW